MGVRKYLRQQFQLSMFDVNHIDASDFYLSSWQRNRCVLPLLCIRAFIFLGCVTLLLTSMTMTRMFMNLGWWFIYLTHWGLVLITVASGLSFLVSVKSCRSSRDFSSDLTWDVKCFWVAYEVATTVAFFITIYALLASQLEDLSINETLDLTVYGMNSILIFLLVVTSRVPGRLLHFVYPLGFTLVYLLFSVIYYVAGGRDPLGKSFIYPTLDWRDPGTTLIRVLIIAIFIIFVQWIIVGITALRDFSTRWYRKDSANYNVTNVPPEHS